jgi:K+-transporting ATPase ATPase C chain
MRAQLLAGLRALLALTVICGLAYPLLVTGIAQAAFGDKADGSLVKRDGQVVGSSLIGQTFTALEYFHGRPSAAGAGATGSRVDVLDADGQPTGKTEPADLSDLGVVASGASNLGPTNRDLLDEVAQRVKDYRRENGLAADVRVPVDAVTSSGSGLDPEISVANARLQAARVAKARGVPEATVLRLIDKHTSGRSLGFLGESGVNVLALNLDLDRTAPGS